MYDHCRGCCFVLDVMKSNRFRHSIDVETAREATTIVANCASEDFGGRGDDDDLWDA